MLRGRVSQAIILVNRLYPGLLHQNKELMFRVLCRQFIEVVSGCDRVIEGEEANGDMGGDTEVAMDTDSCREDVEADQDNVTFGEFIF